MKVNLKFWAIFVISTGIGCSVRAQTSWVLSGNSPSSTDYVGTFNTQPLQLRTTLAQPIVFQTSGAANERMRITPTGFLGLGTAAPVSLLHLNSATAAAINSRFTNSITGVTATDGFQLGITNTGAAEIRQFEKS